MTLNFKIRLVQIFCHFAALAGVIWSFYEHNFWWLGLSVLAFWVTGVLGINIGLHRYLAHRSFETSRWKAILLSLVSVVSVVGTPLSWCGLHRWHHAHSDTESDPHSPHTIGNWKAWFGFWRPVTIPHKYVEDLLRDPMIVFVHRYYFALIAVYVGILAWIHPLAPAFVFAIPAVFCLHSTSAISVLCHRWGYRTYKTTDHSYNNWLASLITLGEGWHNNHHGNPREWKQGLQWWELDPPAVLIRHFFMKTQTQIRNDESSRIE